MSFDEIVEDISLKDDIPACFTEKCFLFQMTKKGKSIDNIQKGVVYESLERLIYADYVVEDSDGFYANFDIGDYGKAFELVEDRCLECGKFENYMQKHRYIDDKYDEDDLDFDDEKDIDDLLRDLESLKKEMESLDLFGGMDESKKEDAIKAKPSLEIDILQRLRDKYNNK